MSSISRAWNYSPVDSWVYMVITQNTDSAVEKTNGAEKLFWIRAVVFVSWFAWILYLILAPLGGEPCER
jgi:uncharacterized phage-associated protein